MRLAHPHDLEPLGRLAEEAGIGLTLIDASMAVVWANGAAGCGELPSGDGPPTHCFAAKWGRTSRCPDCIPRLVFRTGEARRGMRERAAPGQPRQTYWVRAIPVEDSSGEVRWVLECTMHMAEAELPEATESGRNHLLTQMSAASGSGLLVLDLQDRIVSWSPAATTILGFELDEILGRSVSALLPEDRADEERAIAERVARSEQQPRIETVRRARDGRDVPVAITAAALRGEDGELIGRTEVIEDLSAVHQLRRALRAREQLLAHITREAGDAILGIDLEGRVTSWNRGAEEVFGHAPDEVIGLDLGRLAGTEDTRHLVDLARGRRLVRGHRMEWHTADGRRVPVDVTARLLGEDRDGAVGVAMVARDLSAQLRGARQMLRSEKLAAVGSLAAGLAHEIGTPLNVISATVEYLLLDLDQGDPSREELASIVEETERIGTLVRELLSFARGAAPDRQEVHPQEALDRVLRLLHATLDKKQVTVRQRVAADVQAFAAHPDEMHQLLLNLLLNAINAVDKGGRLLLVARMADATEAGGSGAVTFEVHDDGPGIPEDVRERVFDPFFTTRADGTGLGLAVCARIVNHHRGDIRIAPSGLGGACFVVQIPVQQE